MSNHRFAWRVFLGLGCLGVTACDAPGGPGGAKSWLDAGALPQDGGTTPATLACNPAKGSEDLGPRVSVLNAIGMGPVATGPRVIQVTELFDRFNTLCGQCHVATGNGGKQTSAKTFATTFDATWLGSIKSEDPTKAMPPEGKVFSSRPDGDPVRQLVALLEPWLAQNRPADMFTLDNSPAAADGVGGSAAAGSYAYASMTNVGDCIAPAALYAQSPSDEMTSKDDFFASATSLPDNLSDTDLTTFDADTLTANGVVAFVPTYPLWSDGSGKLRHIRVPKGTSVKFDKATQSFTIPPNTRFYKTFFRKVTDSAGRTSNRKIETRVIVARPDTLEADGKTPHQNALFGTYVWSEDELTATLLTTPYRDGTPWADRTIPYVVNEIEYRDVLMSLGPGSGTTFSQRLEDALRTRPDVLQHYAIPGRIRCVQCHQGSVTQNFVLGFLPMQIARRANGTGGTYEPTGADELTQLQRLIDYGVISGMASPADVLTLEQTQAPRHHRTAEELAAQAYMVGNCMHCHNPRGYPSQVKPELSSDLNFLPSPGKDGGGIFEFDLEKYSHVRMRGANQDVRIPYITPSLRDYPVTDLDLMRLDTGAEIRAGEASSGDTRSGEQTWTPKFSVGSIGIIQNPSHDPNWTDNLCGGKNLTENRDYCGKRELGQPFVSAPWRSLIYRNVDTPFPYFDDYVPFPHMPMNTAGFDCRAPRMMGDWMVSIPALRKFPDISEDALPIPGHLDPEKSSYLPYDDSEQPYREVLPTDPDYELAKQVARNRLREYHDDVRYNYCQDVLSPDIFDPLLTSYDTTSLDKRANTTYVYHPEPARYLYGGIPPVDPQDSKRNVQPALGVPYHAHWFDYDPTDSPPPWRPRRGDAWQKVLIDHVPDDAIPAGQKDGLTEPDPNNPSLPNDIDNRRRVTRALSDATLTEDLQRYATTPVPYGVWLDKPECRSKLAAIPKVADVLADAQSKGVAPPAWITASPKLPQDAPVYQMSPGGALYRHICFNCHGPRADGKGLQGDALSASSEGQARPANFRDGLLGPRDDPGQNVLGVFGGSDNDPAAARTMASRYVAWMALGGTLQLIPRDIIHQVEATKILGYSRPNVAKTLSTNSKVSANMLELAKGLCSTILPDPNPNGSRFIVPQFSQGSVEGASAYPFIMADEAPFVRNTGDWEMWMNLCSRFNAPVVRVFKFEPSKNSNSTPANPLFDTILDALYYADPDPLHAGFPKNAPVLDHNKVVQVGVDPVTNYFPACLAPIDPSQPVPQFQLDAFVRATSVAGTNGSGMPTCPPEFLSGGRALWQYADDADPDTAAKARDNVAAWTLRGAINAGMAVFSYLSDRTVFDPDHPAPYYNDCQLLP